MTYNNIHKGTFINRPNRFIAEVEINGKIERCHVKNTGRLGELLIPGVAAYVDYAGGRNSSRSTAYDLVAVYKGDTLVNVDSQAPNRVFGEYLRQGGLIENITHIKQEAKYENSRFDFYVETTVSKAFIEVKGVTLEESGIAMFPDAPTERGVKHLKELAACITAGYDAYAVFIIKMQGVTHFTPNNKTHQAFGDALAEAAKARVKVLAFDCVVMPNELTIDKSIPVILKEGAK